VSDILLSIPVDDRGDDWLVVEGDITDQEEGVQLAAAGQGVRARITSFTVASAMRSVMPAIETVLGRIRESRLAPDEVALEFGLKVGGEHGVILTKGTATANIKLTVTWRSPDRQAPDGDDDSSGGEDDSSGDARVRTGDSGGGE